MNELKKYMELRASKQEEMDNLMQKVQKEERALTDEENALFDQLEKDILAVNTTIEKINKSRELAKTEEDNKAGNDADETKTETDTEKRELEEFGKYIRNEVLEVRAESTNFTKGDNGVIIPTSIANKIMVTAYNVSPILEKVTNYNTKGKLSIPVYGADDEGNDITVGYAEDFKELTAKAGKFSSVDLESYLIGALAKIGNSLINNTDIDLANHVIRILADYIRRFLEGQLLKGSDNKIQGCKGITKKHEVATPVITYDDLVKTKNKVIQAFRKGSIWVMNQDTCTQIELIKDSQERPVFHTDPTGEFDGMILGYPVYVSDNMDGIESGKRPIIFGNFAGLALKKSKELEIQVLREKYATEHATGIVAWMEADSKIENLQALSALDVRA